MTMVKTTDLYNVTGDPLWPTFYLTLEDFLALSLETEHEKYTISGIV